MWGLKQSLTHFLHKFKVSDYPGDSDVFSLSTAIYRVEKRAVSLLKRELKKQERALKQKEIKPKA